jgi:dihydrofolate reductase
MRRLILWNVVTLDGLFEGEHAWDLPWHEKVWGDELERFSLEQLRAADMLVFGRITYEGMAAYWRAAEGEIAVWMNRLPKLACSRTLASADWENTTLARDGVAAVEALKRDGDRDMFVFGSGLLSRALLAAGLFDELRLAVAPVVHGKGRLLFDDSPPAKLALLENRALASGAVLLRYRPEAA